MKNKVFYIIVNTIMLIFLLQINLGNFYLLDVNIGYFLWNNTALPLLIIIPIVWLLAIVLIVLAVIIGKNFSVKRNKIWLSLMISFFVATHILSMLFGAFIIKWWVYVAVDIITVPFIIVYTLTKDIKVKDERK